jgi:hypothetical protein
MMSLMDHAYSLIPTMLSQPMEDARLGTGPTPNARNAHQTGYSIQTVSVFLFLTSADPQMLQDSVLDATEDTILTTDPACSQNQTTLHFLTQDAKFGTGKRTPAQSALTSGICQEEFVLKFQLSAKPLIPQMGCA